MSRVVIDRLALLMFQYDRGTAKARLAALERRETATFVCVLCTGCSIFLLPCAGGGGRRIFPVEASKQILQRI